jgi:type I restriction enzyme M protein
MLDVVTKRRIDTARDIMVGKLPDPKSQVEQITIALIYKFMDDMDRESLELGGKAKFFTGEYSKYAWSKIFEPKLSGYETVNVYGEAIQRMNQNPNIPQLFRDIFKNAYLPYRDPETLKSFLKVINDFEYDHSERLGDAFEYLLSVLGSQGEAGQFRTPRHIIDFMVAIVDPKKNETVLDPACGTAGFLISSYKHILKHNSENFDPEKDPRAFELHGVRLEEITINNKKYVGDKLTSDDRERLVKNVVGYDISPDMVRLSLVNMYLHGFSNPRIFEYDTLTSEEKWSEYADVIMANPPFMSPKGGIRPHKRFSIESSRSEVLFVDYIAEHLNPQGRAAVIVPEGIIFQTQTTHKNLRKMLIEKNYLVGVISLPAGVFNPYSGVKTSILWMDRTLAKKTGTIMFIKIENDGFDLGAQRRPIRQNDLPDAFRAVQAYKDSLESGECFDANKWQNGLVVEKSKIAEGDDYNLSRERYKPLQARIREKWPVVELGQICQIISGQSPEGTYYNDAGEGMPFYQGKIEFTDKYIGPPTKWTTQITRIAEADDILMSVRAPVGPVNFATQKICIGRGLAAIRASRDKIDKDFLFYILKDKESEIIGNKGTAFDSINRSDIESIRIPLPPLEGQKQIVAEIEGYQKIVTAARQIVESYKPHIDIDPSWPMVELGEVCENLDSKRIPIEKSDRKTGSYPYYGASGIVDYVDSYIFDEDLLLISEDGANLKARVTPIAFSVSGKIWVNNHAHVLHFGNMSTQKFVELYLNATNIENYITGAAQPKLTQKALNSMRIPLPDLNIQDYIVGQIEKEQELVNCSKELIEIFEQKIKDRIAQVWGEK